MGLDIHSFIEISRNSGKTWELDTKAPFKTDHFVTPDNPLPGQISMGRFPEMFWLMTGVMGIPINLKLNGIERCILANNGLTGIPPPLRGLPVDTCDEIVKYWGWQAKEYPGCESGDAYPSWLTYTELRLICDVYKRKRLGGLWGFRDVLRRMKNIEKRDWRARYVFWFSY